jgi:predicted dehydrogenase
LTIQQLIKEDAIGDFLDVQISFERYRTTLSPKKHKESVTPGAGLLYDLGPHLVDQAILLSGMPLAVFADIRITRKVGIVDDYFHLILYYPGHRITLTSGMVFMTQLAGYKIYGTKGCFIKNRSDVQEADLIAGKIPGADHWGVESKEDYGTLYTDNDGLISHRVIPSKAGNYGIFYEKMADAILNNAEVPTSAQEGKNIIRILEAARNSAFNKRVVGL